jgi:hypothetical protein
VRTRTSDTRASFILGHELEVYLFDDGNWGVAVDGEEMLGRFVNPYGAWALGAAESYRQGRTPGALPTSAREQRSSFVEDDRGFLLS